MFPDDYLWEMDDYQPVTHDWHPAPTADRPPPTRRPVYQNPPFHRVRRS